MVMGVFWTNLSNIASSINFFLAYPIPSLPSVLPNTLSRLLCRQDFQTKLSRHPDRAAPLKPIKRRDLIYYLKQLGFDGPYSGKRHQFMLKDSLRITIPNPHQGDISANFLAKILGQAKVDISDWENL